MSLNKVMLIGNVGKDPDVRYLESNPNNPGGNAKVASFPLATTERFRDRNGELRENTEWHNIVAWRNSADVAEKFIRKGTQIFVEGRLRTRQWTDQTGNKRYTTEVVVDNLQLLGKRPDGQENGFQGQGGGYQNQNQGSYQGGYRPAQPAQQPYVPQPQAAAPSQPVQPQQPVNPAYNGPLPAAEPTDDLPF
ncbi:MAG: single-stranded DNA-binding protein [Bacteroidales bacterium]|nr:single-stranded DNA-binding protein [Bacteroidales bacterium]